MSIIQLSLFFLASCLAIFLGHFHHDAEASGRLMVRWGYWWTLVPFALFVHASWRVVGPRHIEVLADSRRLLSFIRKRARPGIFLLLLWFTLWHGQERNWKVVMDEPVLAATALSMHENRESKYGISGYWINGEYYSGTFAIDKRPTLFPFLVSTFHDLLGYNPSNPFRLNGVLLLVLLGLLFRLGQHILADYGGYLACLLLSTVPLLTIVATSGIFDLLNLVLIVLLMLIITSYLRGPSKERLDLLLLNTALLAQTRYESVLFALPVGILILYTWWREKEVHVTPVMILTPFLFVPYLLQRKFIEMSPANWHFRHDADKAFSIDYLGENVRSALDFFLGSEHTTVSSILLTLLSLVAVGYLMTQGYRHKLYFHEKSGELGALLAIGAIILFNAALLMFYHWGQLDDIIASRLALPGLFLQVVLILHTLALVAGKARIPQIGLIVIVLGFFLMHTRPALARMDRFAYTIDRIYSQAVLDFSWKQARKDDLVLPLNSLPAYLGRASTIGLERALQQLDRIALHQKLGTFNRVYVIYIETTPLAITDSVPAIRTYAETAEKVCASFELEILQREKINNALQLVISEVVGIYDHAYAPLEFDLGRLEVDYLGAISAENEAVWDEFTESLPQ